MDTANTYTKTLEKIVQDLFERPEDLVRTAFTDQLTGLGNRGGFTRSLEELWEQGTPVTMAFIDIDNLKHCNDAFGHDEGNRYIMQVSLYLKLYIKVDEAVFRLGGDEFANVERGRVSVSVDAIASDATKHVIASSVAHSIPHDAIVLGAVVNLVDIVDIGLEVIGMDARFPVIVAVVHMLRRKTEIAQGAL